MVLVTGATGFIGGYLISSLLKDGVRVYALSRKKDHGLPEDDHLIVMEGDVTDIEDIPCEIKTIYHLAGVIEDPERMMDVNVGGTKRVAEIALKKRARIIHLSSAGVTGETEGTYIDENTPCNPRNLYEKTKLQAEVILNDYARKGLQVSILRPTIVFGIKKDIWKDSFFQLIRGIIYGRYVHIGDGKGVYNIIHVDEVVRAMRMLANMKINSGETFLINTPITFYEFSKTVYEEVYGEKKDFSHIPYTAAFMIALISSALKWSTGKGLPLTISRFKALTNKKVFKQEKLMEKTLYRPVKPVERYIRDVLRWYINMGFIGYVRGGGSPKG